MLKRLLHASIAVTLVVFAGASLAQPTSAEPSPAEVTRSVISGQSAPSVAGVVDIVAGDEFACALLGNGTVKCWGQNWYGQLGDGSQVERWTPVDVGHLNSVVAISGSGHSMCALEDSGEVKCWGRNGSGQIGDGTTTDRTVPVRVGSLGGPAISISAGRNHACALLQSGVLRCWGLNTAAQLGTGSPTPSYSPNAVTVTVVSGNVIQLTVGTEHTCVMVDTGAARCWGSNYAGALGIGNLNPTMFASPQTPIGLSSGVARLVAGNATNCAVLIIGNVLCWGRNYDGQVGDGTTADTGFPTQVTGLASGGVDVSPGSGHSCSILTDGLMCWGANTSGQLGIDSVSSRSTLPRLAWGLLSGVTKVAVGGNHTCAVVDGGVMCWGGSEYGEIGDGANARRIKPAVVLGLEPLPFDGQCVNEGFDTVPPAGWSVKNNSDPTGTKNWYLGNTGYFTAHLGALNSYAASNVDSTGFIGTISDWLVSPVISLTNDARVAIWTRKVDPDLYPDRLQVRLSQAGDSTDVGATAESVGDFATLLYDVNPGLVTNTYPIAWYPLTLTLHGITGTVTGRVAFRYYVTGGGPGGLNSDYIGVDSFTHCIPAAALPATATPTPTPTETATATPTPTATATPFPSHFAFVPTVLKGP